MSTRHQAVQALEDPQLAYLVMLLHRERHAEAARRLEDSDSLSHEEALDEVRSDIERWVDSNALYYGGRSDVRPSARAVLTALYCVHEARLGEQGALARRHLQGELLRLAAEAPLSEEPS